MFKGYLDKLESQHLRRELQPFDSPADPVMIRQGQSIMNLASNNYLGLTNHPLLKEAAISAIHQFGVGSSASRLISGTLGPHRDLETTLAKFKQTEAALTFGSGYATNVGIIPALVSPHGLILADRLCHASLIDGCRVSRAHLRVFQHNDPDHLKTLLNKRPANRPTLIVTEGVFSMDGDMAPLPDIVKLAQEYEAMVLVDDAHGTGVMGPHGRGTAEHFRLDPASLIQMGTLSKALGTMGGYIVGANSFIDYLIHTCRSFIYTTAPPPAMAAAAQAAITIVQTDHERRRRLWQNRDRLYEGLRSLGFRLTNSQSPILPIILNDSKLALDMSKNLLGRGIYIPAIRPPTVPRDTSRLRLTVTSEHTPTQLETALKALQQAGEELHVI